MLLQQRLGGCCTIYPLIQGTANSFLAGLTVTHSDELSDGCAV